jgi:phosphate transport system protein
MTRTQFEDQLEMLRSLLLEMGSMCDRVVGDALQALAERDLTLAERVIEFDDEIDDMDLKIENACLRLLALQQPIARDLRLIGTCLKVITDMERIGDHAVDIAKVARKLSRIADPGPLADLPRMGMIVRKMLRTGLDAFVRHDLELVQEAIADDDKVDDLFHVIREDLLQKMQSQPEIVVEASYSLFVAHYLERMADHAVNIAERVYFVETGELAQLAKSHKTSS